MKKFEELSLTELMEIYTSRNSTEILIPIEQIGIENLPFYDYLFSNSMLLDIFDKIEPRQLELINLRLTLIRSYKAGAKFYFRKVDKDNCCVTVSFDVYKQQQLFTDRQA